MKMGEVKLIEQDGTVELWHFDTDAELGQLVFRRVGLSRQYNLTGSDLKRLRKNLLRYQKIDSVIQYPRNYELEMKITDSYIGGKRGQ